MTHIPSLYHRKQDSYLVFSLDSASSLALQDFATQVDALVTNENSRPSDELGNLIGLLPTERAEQVGWWCTWWEELLRSSRCGKHRGRGWPQAGGAEMPQGRFQSLRSRGAYTKIRFEFPRSEAEAVQERPG